MEAVKNITSIPDPLAPFETKMQKPYGLSIAKMIGGDWFGGGLITSNTAFWERREYVRRKRLFVRGEMDQGYFKNSMVKMDGELNELNLDFTPINWGEKFNRIVSNGLSDKNYRLDVRATDKLSALQKSRQQDYYLKHMISREMLKKVKEMQGIDLLPEDLPEDQDEIKMFLEIKDRPKIEIAEEMLIDFIMKTNNWDFLSSQYDKDLVDVGLMCCRVYIDKNDGVKLAWVDPENYIHSKVTRSDFFDKYYEGVVDTITVSDIKREAGDELTEAELRHIAKTYAGTNRGNLDYDTCGFNEILDYRVHVLRFAYKTSKDMTFKSKMRAGKAVRLSRRDSTFIPPNRSDAGVYKATFDTWVEGTYIIGSDYLYNYKECENLYDDVMNKATSPFITMAHDIYENRLRSFSDNIEVLVKQLQKVSLKIQHLVSELTPDLKEIDLDQLAELDDGKGGVKKERWEQALKIMRVHGVTFKKRIDMGHEGAKDSAAVKPYQQGQGSALGVLLNVAAYYYNQIRENTGINPARDGSMNPDTLVGVNQMAQLASNTVTADIVEKSKMFKQRICETISVRLHTVFSYKEAKRIREVYENVVGKTLLDSVEVMKDRHLHEFGFTFEMYPTAEEMKEFRDDLTLGIQEGSVDPEVKYRAMQIARTNTKLATEYLMYNRRKRMKLRQQEEMQRIQAQSQANIQSTQAAAQAEIQKHSAMAQIDIQKAAKLSEIKLYETDAVQKIQAPVRAEDFQEEVYLKKLESATQWQKIEYQEDRKDERTDLQATQQSQMVEQRQKNKPAIDFKNANNWWESVSL